MSGITPPLPSVPYRAGIATRIQQAAMTAIRCAPGIYHPLSFHFPNRIMLQAGTPWTLVLADAFFSCRYLAISFAGFGYLGRVRIPVWMRVVLGIGALMMVKPNEFDYRALRQRGGAFLSDCKEQRAKKQAPCHNRISPDTLQGFLLKEPLF
jgi:TRAP-type uncharacterized transport system fused permease subunit